ncbi:MAG: hypothetical protein GY820_38680 [Gammaproteobacteria bacterium]|nr:hypothetical protein [Gammaproteobacteria bacterium]
MFSSNEIMQMMVVGSVAFVVCASVFAYLILYSYRRGLKEKALLPDVDEIVRAVTVLSQDVGDVIIAKKKNDDGPGEFET